MKLDNIFKTYNNLDNSSQILLCLIVLVALMLVSIFVINFITKRRNDRYDKKFNPINKYNKVMTKDIEYKKTKVSKVKNEVPQIEVKKENITKKEEVKLPKKEIKEDIEVMDDSEVVEIISENSTIDKISTLIEDNMNNPRPINLTKFEEDEEKNAIISYDELVKRAGAKKIVYKPEKATINEERKEEKIEIVNNENKSKFKASRVISPIYGIQKEKVQKDEIEEFIDVDNIPLSNDNNNDDEMTKDMTFLTNLKTFRSNLD